MSNLKLDFVVYLGDPDAGAAFVPSAKAIEKSEEYKSTLKFSAGVYGAIVVEKSGKALAEKKPDPILPLVTAFVRSIPYLIDGEPESAVLTESECGFSFDPSGDEVLISCFVGDAYDPEEFLIEREPIALESFADQAVGMAERLVTLVKKVEPGVIDDDYAKTLLEFLDTGRSALKTLRLSRERGIRRT